MLTFLLIFPVLFCGSSGLHTQDLNSANQLPFANSANPVMSLVSIMDDLQLEMTREIDI